MTIINSTDSVAKAIPEVVPEGRQTRASTGVKIPKLDFSSKITQTIQTLIKPEKTEDQVLRKLLCQRQYKDIIRYISNFTPQKKYEWLQRNAGYHVPLLFELAITELLVNEDSDFEDVVGNITLSWLRMRQDLKCLGFNEEQQEKITDMILVEQLLRVMEAIYTATEKTTSLSSIQAEMRRAFLVTPFLLMTFDPSRCPSPINWHKYYSLNLVNEHVPQLSASWKNERLEAIAEFEALINTYNSKTLYCPKMHLNQFSPRYKLPLQSPLMRAKFEKTAPEKSNLIGLLFQKDTIMKEIDSWKGKFYGIKENEIKLEKFLEKNLLNTTLLCVWAEKDIKVKCKWLQENTYSKHPLLPFERAIAEFELAPSFNSYKLADFLIRLGSCYLNMEVECTTDNNLLDFPYIIEGYYRNNLVEMAKKTTSECELTKMRWWAKYCVTADYKATIATAFFTHFSQFEKLPPPTWLFKHSIYDTSEKDRSYTEGNNFAFPEWLWNKQRKSYIHNLQSIQLSPPS